MSHESVGIQMNQGNVLIILAKHYADLMAVSNEVVQNAIDSGAKRIRIDADLPRRIVTICDNGSGISREKISEALQSVGNTMKEKDKYGQFGIGLISPLWITKEFIVTSCPDNKSTGYLASRFVRADIETQAKVSIPIIADDSLHFDANGKVWWRTRVEMRGIVKDRRASRLDADELANDIAIKFGEEIRRRHIDIVISVIGVDKTVKEVNVVAPEYMGQKLSPFAETSYPESGKVVAELYIAQLSRKGRKGVITFGTTNNPSRITTKQFVECTDSILESRTAKALASGVFEGRILCDKVALHADRTRFENNDALLGLCLALDTWYKKVGKIELERAEEQACDDRFQRIGTQVMPYAEMLLKQTQFQSVAQQITIGTIGANHAKPPRKTVLGQDEGVSVAVDGNPFVNKGKGSSPDGKKTKETKESSTGENLGHSPGIVYGEHGRKRVEVRGGSTGLRFAYIEAEDFRIPFEYDPVTGLLSFNQRNQNWGLCKASDETLQQYHMAVISTAFTLELFKTGSSVNPEVKKFAFENLTQQTFAIMNGKALLAK